MYWSKSAHYPQWPSIPERSPEEEFSENSRIKGMYCLGKTNIIYERYCFNNRDQEAGKSINTYGANLRSLSDRCNFGALKDEMIGDNIVCVVRDQNLEGLEGVFKLADDKLITGQGEIEREADEEHDRNLKSLLDLCREQNIKLNKKFTFKCNDV